jgi:1-acyl-sn-glycerol-3-phosphate acyltransferase
MKATGIRITLQSLSTRLGIQYYQLSQIVNDNLGTSFRSYINQCWLEEARRLLVAKPEMSILDIAFAVGFNSKSAFPLTPQPTPPVIPLAGLLLLRRPGPTGAGSDRGAGDPRTLQGRCSTLDGMTDFFPGDRYTTSPGIPRAFSEYLLLRSRWSVYSHFISTILRSRALAQAGRYDDQAWAASSREIIGNLERCRARFHIEGMDRVRKAEGPLVFVSNHMSTMETLVLPGLIVPMKPVTYVVKEKLLHGFFWGPIMRSRNPISVSRTDARADLDVVMREGGARLAAGISVIVFPQGTRQDLFDRSKFNSLGVKLAARAGVRLLPVAVKTDFWGSSGFFHGFGPIHRDRPVHVKFGEALAVSGRGKAEHDLCLDFIESRLRAWGAPVA